MIDLYNFEPTLFARCLLDAASITTLNNALAIGATTKTCYMIINSNPFFRGLVYEMDPNHPYFSSKQEKEAGLLKHRFLALRDYFSWKTECISKVPCGDPWVFEEGLELISYNNGIQSHPLKVNSTALDSRASTQYFAVTDGSKVHVYTADRKECLISYEYEGEICQSTIHDHYLSVITRDVHSVCYLVTYDLECLQEESFSIVLPGEYTTPVCFGKDYLIYVESGAQDIAYAIPLFSEGDWTQDVETEGFLYFFSSADHFIEVLFEGVYLGISQVCIENGHFVKTPMTKNFVIPRVSGSSIGAVHFHNNRLFFSHEVPSLHTRLFSYDIELEKLKELTTVPECDEDTLMFPCFISAAEKVYYLTMKLESDEVTSQLTTLKFGKI